ncbi:MAG TPA: HD domain-containing protein [Thermoplasmata archaeon]|nr:HD domain-containing protein [Thermoplasmata archaeon]
MAGRGRRRPRPTTAAGRSAPRRGKSIYDPIHGTITLADAPLALVGEPAFQRLWGIRQTGFAHLVFPGANHTRLEHSLGVYWVARAMAERLALPSAEARAVEAGALLHDLGHPPFSHTYDPTLLEVFGHGHEEISRSLIVGDDPSGAGIAAILERSGIEPERVADLVDPRKRSTNRPLLQSLLHGPVDADRIDYLQRDAHYTGVGHGAIDAVRLLDTVRSFRDRLAFAEKGRSALEGFLVGRSLMYASVYFHKTVRAAEVMAQAALERLAGYPDSARPLLRGTDGELLTTLERGSGAAARLARGLLDRRLHRRLAVYFPRDRSDLGRFRRLGGAPADRRGVEDELAAVIGAPAGAVLLDLSGLTPRAGVGSDFGDVILLDDGRATRPFRDHGLWRNFASLPPNRAPVSVYVERGHTDAPVRIRRSFARLI